MFTEEVVPCSMCRKPLLGRVVGLFDEAQSTEGWEGSFTGPIHDTLRVDGEEMRYVLIHEQCFLDLFEAFRKHEVSVVLQFTCGSMEDIRAGLVM